MNRLVAHWADYADPGYLPFIDAAKPEVAQVGFYGAHFWSLAHTPHGGGYPAHFPVVGHEECAEWFRNMNVELHRRSVKVVGHFNVKFLVGDPETDAGPTGFFDFYHNHWDERLLGPKPCPDPITLLEQDRDGTPISSKSYSIGGMKEYWACLNNPDWRAVLKAWVGRGIELGLDGFVSNYFYRNDCHCDHCVNGFKTYLKECFTSAELVEKFGIQELATHTFDEIGAWHDPAQSTPLRREALRFSQISNKKAFDEVFVQHGRQLKPDLIVAQWNHLGDFGQISGDERCLLPADQWAKDEDYLWYSTGGATNLSNLAAGVLGESTLVARYIRGASGNKPYTLGKYEAVRIRTAIAELAANGGAPMGFYTNFKVPEARAEIVRYYGFLHRNDSLYRGSGSHAEMLLLYPRRRVQDGDVAAVERFKQVGRKLLDEHVLFDVLPDDLVSDASRKRYEATLEPTADIDTTSLLPETRSRFAAPFSVRVSASRSAQRDELAFHFVNYNREEPADKSVAGIGIQDEKPIATPEFSADFKVPANFQVKRIEFLTPEDEQPRDVAFQKEGQRVQLSVPSFLVYGVLRVELVPSGDSSSAATNPRRVAGLVTEYRHNSHADIILSRLLLTDTLDGRGKRSPLELVSLYTDQRPTSDTSRSLAASHGFRISPTIEDALTLGTGELAVDGVMLIAEHGDYPKSPTGNTQYPKRRFWEETLKVFRASNRVVPVFIDKHLADNWEDAKFIYDTANELNVPLMAGSSVPVTWRRPAADVRRDVGLQEIVAITYHTTDAYGFHALEMIQSLAEQRPGGESGIAAVQSLAGDAVWQAMEQSDFDTALFDDAWMRLSQPSVDRQGIRSAVTDPRLFRLQYTHGLRANLLELNGAAAEWSAAWRYVDGKRDSALFWTQEGRPGMHFTYLLRGIEQMMLTGKPTWNVERTLLTSGALDALLISLKEDQRRIETAYLDIDYQPSWRWTEPPPPPPTRPWSDQ